MPIKQSCHVLSASALFSKISPGVGVVSIITEGPFSNLFEALTGGAFDRQNWQHSRNLTKNFQKSQMPQGLPGGAMGGFGIDRYIREDPLKVLED